MSPRKPRYTGVIPPVVTPLTRDGEIDAASLESLVAFLIEGGVSGLFPLGSSGEVAYLTDEKRDRVLEIVVGAAAGQVPVFAGTIETTTNRVIERARTAHKVGADAAVSTAPFYVRTTDDETDQHFREIATATDLPLLAYDVPVSVGRKLDTDRMVALANEGVIAGVKDSSGDDVALRRLTIATAEMSDFSILTGHELVVDSVMLGGADGVVPGLGNVDPHGYRRLVDACYAGDWAAAKSEQDRLVRLFEIVGCTRPGTASPSASGLGAFKTALMLRGVISTNTMSTPMRTFDADETAAVAAILERAGLR